MPSFIPSTPLDLAKELLAPLYSPFRLVKFQDFDYDTLCLLFGALFLIFVISRVKLFLNGLQAVGNIPGMRIPFTPLTLPGGLFPVTWWNPGVKFIWDWRYTMYKQLGYETVSFVPFLAGGPSILTSNMDVARQILSGGTKPVFVRPEFSAKSLMLFGMNVVAANGEVWRKHRRIMGPAFNNNLYQKVWDESVNAYREMISTESWATDGPVEVPVVQKITFQLALLIISKCGFGFPSTWSAPKRAADGHATVEQTLRTIHDHHLILLFAPKWLLALPFGKMREARQAWKQLMQFMLAEVAERKAIVRGEVESSAGKTGAQDVFTMLVKANEQEATKYRLDDQELIGNVYILLFAGHETTANGLAATLGLLAAHADVQEEVYQHILSVIGHDRDPTFSDLAKLDKVLAAFYEAVRMFPAAFVVVREATEDTVLQIPNPVGQEGSTSLPIRKGVTTIIDIVGVHSNPRYFDEPEKYKPSRWYGASPESEALSAFSVGPRACLGRKFAISEGVAFLTMLLRDWRVEPMFRSGETLDEWSRRALEGRICITLGTEDVPVRFVKRPRTH